ncbi:MAG: S49 family peptidase [Proteobacteria bacterium]|nr:S49 family peptidase [Pseudomonadota bacterium]
MSDSIRDFVRLGASFFALPFAAVGGFLHRRLTGDVAILQLRVTAKPSLIERRELIHRLGRAQADEQVAAVVFMFDTGLGGWAANQDLRSAIRSLSVSGTRTYAFLESASNATMYLASACDRVVLVPTGEVALLGAGTELTFFGTLLNRLGVQPDFEAAGEYKSFGEPFTRAYASPANREATQALIEDLHAQLADGVADGRGLERSEVDALIERAPLSASDALEAHLVDDLLYADELLSWLKGVHGQRCNLQPFGSWARRDAALDRMEGLSRGGRRVAVLHLQGPVVLSEEVRGDSLRARTVVPILRGLQESDDVAAVVLHISSPGGSALASDLIWREVDKLGRDKPVVAVFEDVAASGGYYLAAPAAEIVARPGTLTGSIGVFGGKLVVGDGLRTLGVSTQPVLASESATMYSPTRRFTDSQRERFRASLQRVYDGFVERVAAGRGKGVGEIEPHCRGRVWTGRAALDNGLVDRFGTLDVGIERARALASLGSSARVVHLDGRPRRPLLQRLIGDLVRPTIALGHLERLGFAISAPIQAVLLHPAEPLAMLPHEIEFR